MKKRFTEEQIIDFLREAESVLPVAELCRRHGFSETNCYLWRNKFGSIDLPPFPVPIKIPEVRGLQD